MEGRRRGPLICVMLKRIWGRQDRRRRYDSIPNKIQGRGMENRGCNVSPYSASGGAPGTNGLNTPGTRYSSRGLKGTSTLTLTPPLPFPNPGRSVRQPLPCTPENISHCTPPTRHPTLRLVLCCRLHNISSWGLRPDKRRMAQLLHAILFSF